MRASRLPRVCYVLPSLSVGGTERQLVHLVRGIIRDFEVTVVCTQREGALAGDLRRLGAYVHCLHCRGGWDPRMKYRLRTIFRRHRPDVLHTFLSGFDYAANAAAADLGVPVIVSSRRELATWMKRRHIMMQRRANALVDCIVANCEAVRTFAQHQEQGNPNLYRVIYNGIDSNDYSGNVDRAVVRRRLALPEVAPIVGMVANYSPVKDHGLFLAMARDVASRRPDTHFLLVGGGRRGADDLERFIAREGGLNGIHIISTLADLPDLYSVMSVKVLTSKEEGFPNVILEAMASAVPVVATAVGGIPEAIADGVTGILVHSRRPDELADAVCRLLSRPEDAVSMGIAGRARVEARFSEETMTAQYRALYDELLESRGH